MLRLSVGVNGIEGIGDEMWSKFHSRIYIMREMYHTWKDNDMSLWALNLRPGENGLYAGLGTAQLTVAQQY